jgi:hypothetical protein
VESLLLLGFILTMTVTPWGMAVLFFAFLISCLSRVFLRSTLLKNRYMIVSFVPLLYLLVLGIAFSSPAIAPTGNGGLLVMFVSMFLGVPFSIGWLLGWPIAVLVQVAAQGPNSSPPEQSESNWHEEPGYRFRLRPLSHGGHAAHPGYACSIVFACDKREAFAQGSDSNEAIHTA